MKPVLFFCLTALAQTACTQDAGTTIQSISEQFQKGRLTVTEALTNKAWMPLHAQPAFREIIRQNARAEKITLTTPDEPGLKTTVKGAVADRSGNPVSDALIYVYQTSGKGWYSDTAAHILIREGDMHHARLFGYLKTDSAGRFEFETIRPEGYPKSDLPAHIHIMLWSADGKPISGMPGELLFDEDKRLTPERRQQALRDGFLISKNTGTKSHAVYEYHLK